MGSLIAIMTQWLARVMRRLELGLTPISMRDHVVILGWTNRTPELVAKLLGAKGRLERFLEERGLRKLHVVVLSDEVGTERRVEMRGYLGALWNDSQIFLRSGSSLRPEHLERLDLGRAAVVLVPGSDYELGGAELSDARVVKTLITMRNLFRGLPREQRPQVVAEIFDSQMMPVAVGALAGVEVVTADRVVSRLLSQSIRHRGLAGVLFGLLTHREGNSLYLRGFPDLVGKTLRELNESFEEAVVIGVVRRTAGALEAVLDPGSREILREGDLLILLAESYARCRPIDAPADAPAPERVIDAWSGGQTDQRVLVLGWSHKAARLMAELDEARSGGFDVTIMSRAPLDEREAVLQRFGLSGEHVRIRHLVADYAVERDLVEADPRSFDHILFVASSGMSSSDEADARTVFGHELLRAVLAGADSAPEILVELLEPGNAHLFGDSDHDLVLVSPQVLSHVLAHVALRPELNTVFDALFCSGGTEFGLCPAGDLGLAGQEARFSEIQAAAFEHGVIALGVLSRPGRELAVDLNPDRRRTWTLGESDRVVVLMRMPAAS